MLYLLNFYLTTAIDSFFTPFVPEVPYNILLYLVVHCTKGVVELTYK